MARAETLPQRKSHPRRSSAEKRRIVELALREGASYRSVASAHGVSRQSLRNWIAMYRAGTLEAPAPQRRRTSSGATFLPVTIATATQITQPKRYRGQWNLSVVKIALPSGSSLQIETELLDVGVLCALIAQLQR
jgi:transposase-like protein